MMRALSPTERPVRILISAYSCEPGRGSEPGIGWNWVEQSAQHHLVWVLTRANNRQAIDERLRHTPLPNAQFIYFDLPEWARRWKRGQRGFHLYYQLWQMQAYFVARRLHQAVHFNLVHHVTLGAYWKPTYLSLLPVPFLWGPVGGGEISPRSLRRTFGLRGRISERARTIAQFCSRLDPFLHLTARKARWGLATTSETETQMRRLGCSKVSVVSQAGLPSDEIELLGLIPFRESPPFRILGIGRLLHWKGFDLAMRGFAKFHAQRPDSEYWIAGDGPERRRLSELAEALGLGKSVKIWGQIDRPDLRSKLAECDVVTHPSLHDSGGWACLEGMAAGKPVVCLDCGGPGSMITSDTGMKIQTGSVEQVVDNLANEFERLASDPVLRFRMGVAARARVRAHFAWDVVGRIPDHVLDFVVE
jgi:glycosyltransferase involved in cell wall biosynthesis